MKLLSINPPRFALIFLVFLYCAGYTTGSASQQTNIHIPAPRSNLDISHDYHVELLNLAFQSQDLIPGEINLISTSKMTQQRQITQLEKQQLLDVIWLGTETNLEQRLRAIRVPTTRGLIGYRKFIIHRDNLTTFEKINGLQALRDMVACQGAQWPDTQILQHANLPVTTSVQYEDLFKMVQAKRCDYFPRGLHDHKKELQLRESNYPNLMAYSGTLLYYPFAVYFFVNQQNQLLGDALEKGMETLAARGEILTLMRNHPLTQQLFPYADESSTVFIQISNPLLHPHTDTQNNNLWFRPEEFGLNAGRFTRPVGFKNSDD